jgi:hypothetical protein
MSCRSLYGKGSNSRLCCASSNALEVPCPPEPLGQSTRVHVTRRSTAAALPVMIHMGPMSYASLGLQAYDRYVWPVIKSAWNIMAGVVGWNLQKQKHFTIMANYTYNKSLDDLPSGQHMMGMNVNLPNVFTIPWNMPGRHQMDFGPSSFDRTQRSVASYVWNLPALTTANPFFRLAAGGWRWPGITTKQTGDPLTILAAVDQSQTALNSDRAVQVASAYGGNAAARLLASTISTQPRSRFRRPARSEPSAREVFAGLVRSVGICLFPSASPCMNGCRHSSARSSSTSSITLLSTTLQLAFPEALGR